MVFDFLKKLTGMEQIYAECVAADGCLNTDPRGCLLHAGIANEILADFIWKEKVKQPIPLDSRGKRYGLHDLMEDRRFIMAVENNAGLLQNMHKIRITRNKAAHDADPQSFGTEKCLEIHERLFHVVGKACKILGFLSSYPEYGSWNKESGTADKTVKDMKSTSGNLKICVSANRSLHTPVQQGKKVAVKTWGPERETFTWNQPARKRTMNSITDNPRIGDERNFVRIRRKNSNDLFSDNAMAEPGEEYEVYVYFHNNANVLMNNDGTGIANNVRLRLQFPEVISDGQAAMVKGILSATNTDPESVWDTAYIHAPEKQTVYLRCVPNSAVIHSFGTIDGQILPDSALYGDDGAKLGYYDKHWGVLPGCNEYSGYVKAVIRVDQPGFYVQELVSLDGGNSWDKIIDAGPGEILDFVIRYVNMGTAIQRKVTFFDSLPKGLSYIRGSSRIAFSKKEEAGRKPMSERLSDMVSSAKTENDSLFGGGIIAGDFVPGDECYLFFRASVSGGNAAGENILFTNTAVATGNGTIHSRVEVVVSKNAEAGDR